MLGEPAAVGPSAPVLEGPLQLLPFVQRTAAIGAAFAAIIGAGLDSPALIAR